MGRSTASGWKPWAMINVCRFIIEPTWFYRICCTHRTDYFPGSAVHRCNAAGAYDGTILPLVGGFAVLSIVCLMTMHRTEKITSQVLGSIAWRAKQQHESNI